MVWSSKGRKRVSLHPNHIMNARINEHFAHFVPLAQTSNWVDRKSSVTITYLIELQPPTLSENLGFFVDTRTYDPIASVWVKELRNHLPCRHDAFSEPTTTNWNF